MVGTTMEREISVSDIIAENEKRRNEMFARFNPISGNPLVKGLIKHKGIDGFLRNVMGVEPTPEDREAVLDRFVRLRCRHDFPFWAATFVYIKNKEVGEPDCLFRLTYPQRRFVAMLERMRLTGKPIRIILLKARQWGGSTTSQLYMAWMQLIHRTGLNSLIITY